MSDRELLELASKAMGYDLNESSGDMPKFFIWSDELGGFLAPTGRVWNPLTDDGDALRLAIHLMIDIGFGSDGKDGFVCALIDGEPSYASNFKGDAYAATRRGIVLAAAEIGKAMK